MKPRQIAMMMLAALVPFAVSAAPKDHTVVTASNKKPGQTCTDVARPSNAYKQCIQEQAHTGQKPKSLSHYAPP
jgi:hypothetical protein